MSLPIVLALVMLLLVVLHCQGGPFVLQMTKGGLLHDWHHESALSVLLELRTAAQGLAFG